MAMRQLQAAQRESDEGVRALQKPQASPHRKETRERFARELTQDSIGHSDKKTTHDLHSGRKEGA